MLLLIAYTKNIDQLKKYLYMLYSSLVISKHTHEPKVSRKTKDLKNISWYITQKGCISVIFFIPGCRIIYLHFSSNKILTKTSGTIVNSY